MNNQDKTREELLSELEQLQEKYDSLLRNNEEQATKSREKIKSLFNVFPIAISENDFSMVKQYFDELKQRGVVDFSQYFNHIPNKRDEVLKFMHMVKLVDLNQAHYQLYGVTKEQFISLVPYIINNYDDKQIDEYINQFVALAEGKLFYVQEMPPHKTVGGDLKHVIAYLQVTPGCERDLSKVYVVYIDVTERRNAEEALRESEAKLRALNVDKDQFITILAHDLKSPFSSILGFLDLLATNARRYDIDTIEAKINIIKNSAQSVYNLLEGVLMWIRTQSGKMEFEPDCHSITDIVSDVVDDIKPAAAAKNITITVSEYEDIVVFADFNMIKTVLRNLISNAVKFTHRNGRIIVSVKNDRGKVAFTVSDNGVGMSPETLNKLFDISQKHSSPGTANEMGTGFGLILCKEFIERHNGCIWVESNVGQGSDFKFYIPAHKMPV